MASIEKRIAKNGALSFRITVCAGFDQNGKKIRKRMTYLPDDGLTERQAEKPSLLGTLGKAKEAQKDHPAKVKSGKGQEAVI